MNQYQIIFVWATILIFAPLFYIALCLHEIITILKGEKK